MTSGAATRIALLTALLAASGAAAAAASETVEAYQAAKQRCEDARVQKLKPIREEKVAQCVRSGRDRQYCETFYSTYGDNSNHANGSVVRGRFYDLPACREAREALRKMNGPQKF